MAPPHPQAQAAPLFKFSGRGSDLGPTMTEDRARTGSLIAAVGSALLAVSVFQPWYAVKLTASGVASAQQTINSIAAQYGNAAFQSQARGLGSSFSTLTGHQIATLSAHQTLKYLHIVLLILAAIAFLLALSHLAGASQPTQTSGSQIAPIGVMATLCVVFRMIDRPAPPEEVFSLSLSWGIWLALGSCLAIILGGIWRRHTGPTNASDATLRKALEELSGWTPAA
ncbi:MAG: hypothetical protein WB709_00875 [Solirubrobacteraceae bacterium]